MPMRSSTADIEILLLDDHTKGRTKSIARIGVASWCTTTSRRRMYKRTSRIAGFAVYDRLRVRRSLASVVNLQHEHVGRRRRAWRRFTS